MNKMLPVLLCTIFNLYLFNFMGDIFFCKENLVLRFQLLCENVVGLCISVTVATVIIFCIITKLKEIHPEVGEVLEECLSHYHPQLLVPLFWSIFTIFLCNLLAAMIARDIFQKYIWWDQLLCPIAVVFCVITTVQAIITFIIANRLFREGLMEEVVLENFSPLQRRYG